MVYTDRWCFCNKNHKECKRFANFVSFFRFTIFFTMFDYRGDKVLVDHDSGLGWILLRTEISRRMKSHAVRPCARRRRRDCPFPSPPCRPGRRRICVYGRNELHPSRHGHLTGLGAFGRPAPRAARVLRAPGQSGHRAPRRPRQARPSRVVPRDFTSERSGVKSRSSRPPRREHGQIAQRTGGGAVVGADVPGGPPSARDV